jgi:hypothetical protein
MTFKEAIRIVRTMEFASDDELSLATEIVCTAAENYFKKSTNLRLGREYIEAQKEALIWRNPFGPSP